MSMESKKNIIQIIEKATDYFVYDKIYYFTGIDIVEGKINVRTTGDVWKATRFNNDMSLDEVKPLCKFIKANLGKRYEIKIITITLNYEV